MGACILDGAVIEANAFIAAGAVIGPGKRVRSGELWAGNPARLMRQLSRKGTSRACAIRPTITCG